jgi:hypothetical protein
LKGFGEQCSADNAVPPSTTRRSFVPPAVTLSTVTGNNRCRRWKCSGGGRKSSAQVAVQTGPIDGEAGYIRGGPKNGQPSYAPTILVTLFFGIIGLWPANRHSRMARERGFTTSGYWWAFWLALLVPLAALAVLVVTLAIVVRHANDTSSGGDQQSAATTPVVGLGKAASNTLAAPNYTEVVNESTSQGKQTDHLVWQAPDRLGGYIQSGNKRTYVYVFGSVQYQSLTVSANASTDHLQFYKQASQPAATLDPVHNYLQYASQAKGVTQSGETYSFSLNQGEQVGNFSYKVNGQYISVFALTVSKSDVRLVVSRIGTSPQVALPPGSTIVTTSTVPAG